MKRHSDMTNIIAAVILALGIITGAWLIADALTTCVDCEAPNESFTAQKPT